MESLRVLRSVHPSGFFLTYSTKLSGLPQPFSKDGALKPVESYANAGILNFHY